MNGTANLGDYVTHSKDSQLESRAIVRICHDGKVITNGGCGDSRDFFLTTQHKAAVAAFYASEGKYEEIESRFNGCYFICKIDGITYLDCELHGELNSTDNPMSIVIIMEDKRILTATEPKLSYSRHARD